MTFDRSATKYLRGSTEQCPKCGSRKVAFDPDLKAEGYGPGIAMCQNCRTLWEAFDPEQIWDKNDPYCSLREPCNNCAFRHGSSEQKDPEFWRGLIDQLKCGGQFYCHKGVPIGVDEKAKHGFAYPTKQVKFAGQVVKVEDVKRMRLCRGFLKALPALRRAYEKGVANGTLDVLSIKGYVGDEESV